MGDIIEKTGNITDILNILNRAQEAFSYEIFIPSLDKSIMFRQINTNQQKRLIKSVIDNQAYNTEFIFVFKQIIEENCVEKIDFAALTIYDKLVIALTMRSMSIGDEYGVAINVDGGQKIEMVISLKDLYDKAISTIHIEDEWLDSGDKSIRILCGLPTIWDEYKLENELHKNVKVEIKTDLDLRETIGEVFINEIVKYVKSLHIKQDENYVQIDLVNLSFKERIKIIGSLNAQLTTQILKYMKKVNDEFAKVTIVKLEHGGKTYEERLKIDASFFTPS